MLPIVLFNAFQQTAGRKRIDCSICQADSIFGMRRVVREGFILRRVTFKCPVCLRIEDHFAAVRSAIADAAIIEQAEMLAVFRRPLCTERPVCFIALRVIRSDHIKTGRSQVCQRVIPRLQIEIARVEVNRLKAERAEAMRPQQALVECKAQARRVRRIREGVVATVQVVEILRLREVLNVVLYAFHAFLRRQMRHGSLHPSARSGKHRRKPVARIIVFSARQNMVDCISLVIIVGIPSFLR